jgi:hypothetical protein
MMKGAVTQGQPMARILAVFGSALLTLRLPVRSVEHRVTAIVRSVVEAPIGRAGCRQNDPFRISPSGVQAEEPGAFQKWTGGGSLLAWLLGFRRGYRNAPCAADRSLRDNGSDRD